MPTQAERLAAVETELRGLRGDVRETREDVKTLLAAYNRQQGFISLGKTLWIGVVGVVAWGADMLARNWHTFIQWAKHAWN